jgi:Kef-type K+ transport system membrane component KefB
MFRPVQFDPTSLVLITAAVAVAPLVSAAVPVVLVPTVVVELLLGILIGPDILGGLVSVLVFPAVAVALRRAARAGEAPA